MFPASVREDATLASLRDFHEIVDTLYRFAMGQDIRDRDLFESAFAPDAVLDFTQPARRFGAALAPLEGRTAIADTVFETIARLDTTHTVTNPRVVHHDDGATLLALVEAQHVSTAEPARRLLLKNRYTVELRYGPAGWLIERMVIHTVWHDGDPTVLFG